MVVIGDGPERQRCEQLAQQLDVANRVTFLGWLAENADVAAVYRSARVFILNSRSEGGPRVTLEAMACGLPVISTPVGVMIDVLQDRENGLFTTGVPEDLARQMKYLLSDVVQRDAMGAAAQEALEQFDRTTLIGRYADFLKSLS
mgnify:FL=1